jgi:hypothetical protein
MGMRYLLLAATLGLGTGCIDTSGLVFDAEGGGAGSAVGYQQEVLSDGPLGYWPLDVLEEGTRTPDISGNDHDAFLDDANGAGTLTFDVAGAVPGGTAVQLAAGGALFVGPPHPLTFGNGSYTLEMWLRVDSGDLAHVASSTEPGGGGYTTYVSVNTITHKRYTAQDFEQISRESVAMVDFRHLVISYDDARNEGQITLDGVPLLTPPGALMLSWNEPGAAFFVGQTGSGEDITLDDVAVYDQALPLARIQRHHCVATGTCD